MWFVLSESLCLSARSQKRKNHFRSRASVSYVLISSSTFPLSLLVLKRSSFVAKRSGFVYIKNANRFRQSVQNNWLARCSFSSIRVRRWSLHVLVFCNTQLYFLLFEKWHQQLDVSTSCKVCKDMTSIYSICTRYYISYFIAISCCWRHQFCLLFTYDLLSAIYQQSLGARP